MRKILISIAVALGCASTSWAGPAAPASSETSTVAPLNSINAIASLTTAEAGRQVPVDFEGTVTYSRGYQKSLFVQDGGAGIWVAPPTIGQLVPGDHMRVKGETRPGYRPYVASSEIEFLGRGTLPRALPATWDGLIRGRFDSLLVTARGVVQSADLDALSTEHARGTTLRVLLDGGYADVQLDSSDTETVSKFLDATVEITGVAGGNFDGKQQLTGIVLHVARLEAIRILKPAATSPWSLPITPMDDVLSVYRVANLTSRIRVTGTITAFQPGSMLVLQDGDKSIWVKTTSFGPYKIGDRADATGFPAVSNGFLTLYGSAILDQGVSAPIVPERLAWKDLASSRHIFDLVSIDGVVEMEAREDSQDEYVLVSEGHIFSAVIPRSKNSDSQSPMKYVPVGARIRLTGICVMQESNAYEHEVPFNILLRSPDDLEILAMPTWFNSRHLSQLVLILLLGIVAVGARAWFVDRTMRAQVAALGYLGQRRGVILEDINNSRPLPGILESITELASASLRGAPCWCATEEDRKYGNCPSQPDSASLRIVEHPIAARSGPALGSIYAAFDARTTADPEEGKALAAAAELATLAIETARLYSDLVHRSEFDMLTDIKNRFSFEKHLDCLLDEAFRTGGVFGLIYIDLDEFKQVNDKYGHHVGDLFMQQAALRMKRQLRPEDMLARLGGDEFAVLVPVVQKQSDVVEIAARLESCFDAPFGVEGYRVPGSASFGIALYPSDASTRDGLLTTADSAMYSSKNMKKRNQRASAEKRSVELAPETRA